MLFSNVEIVCVIINASVRTSEFKQAHLVLVLPVVLLFAKTASTTGFFSFFVLGFLARIEIERLGGEQQYL